MTKNTSYSDLEALLLGLDVHISAAEVHGLLVGMLSVSEPKDLKVWRTSLEDILDCEPPSRAQWSIFTKLKTKIIKDFKQRTFSFNLLLPDDAVELSARLQCLADWCRGYLSGLGLVGLSAADLINPEIKEPLEDLAQIAQVSTKTDASETDEKNFMELLEYVRIAVQNIYLELQISNRQQMLH